MSEWDGFRARSTRVREFAYAERAAAPESSPRPKVGLALGGGFARGIAHLACLHALKKNISIDYIFGTSAERGRLVFGSGLPFDEVARRAAAHQASAISGKGDFPGWAWRAIERLESYPERFLGVKTFEDLRYPLSIAATDLIDSARRSTTRRARGLPLRASCAYPALFQPVEYEGRLLVDGFVAAAVPVEGARKMGADVIIAVILEAESMQRPRTVIDVIGRSFSIVRLQADAAWQLKGGRTIVPRVREFAWDAFTRTPQLVAAGELAAIGRLCRASERRCCARPSRWRREFATGWSGARIRVNRRRRAGFRPARLGLRPCRVW